MRLAALICMLLLALPASAEQVLRMSSPYPHSHPLMSQGFSIWAERVEEVTDGRVKVQILPREVVSFARQYDVAATGQADISMGNQSYSPGRFYQYRFAELPGNGASAEATSVAYWRTYQKYFGEQSEMSEVKLLTLHTAGPGDLFTRHHVVDSLQGNQGVKVRGGGVAATRIVDALGMTSIQAPFSTAAQMISNGVVDGAMLDRSLVAAFSFDRYFNNRFTYEGGLYNVSYFMVMNRATWNALSTEDQAAIDAISGEALSRRIGQIWDELGQAVDEKFESEGMITSAAQGDFKTSLDEIFRGYEQAWMDGVAQTGVDGMEVIRNFRETVRTLEQPH